ncbi:MAG: response regulator [Bdellovibrionia bacterium]
MVMEMLEWMWLGAPAVPNSVLVVEDDPSQKPILARILYAFNPSMDLLWASSAEEAKNILNEKPIDLLITDILLEGEGTGIDLYQECAKANSHLPVLFISGLSAATLEKRGISLSKSGIEESAILLPKPVSPLKCHDSITELMRRKAWEDMATSYLSTYI